ncbi:hypothetical protein ACFQZ4_36915 [Catellatospora coxensis]|nr:hypothetical protein [Catellatospora coxensis]
MSLRPAPIGQFAHQTRARIHDGVAVFTADVLDQQRAAQLRATAAQLTGSGPFLVQGLTVWTDAGLNALAGDDHGPSGALIAPPARLLAASPGAALDMFPSVHSAVTALRHPPSPLPLPPAGADSQTRSAHRVFTTEPTAMFGARHWIRGLLADWATKSPTDRALVAFSELAAASVATTSTQMHVSVNLWRDPDGALALTVGVRDDDPVLAPAGGRRQDSLRLVAALSRDMGLYRQAADPAGKVAWFTMPVTPQADVSQPCHSDRGRHSC